MKKENVLGYYQIKFFVKSPILFYLFMLCFITLFFYLSSSLQLDIRKTFSGVIDDGVLIIQSTEKICKTDDTIYIYKNKNQKVIKANIIDESFQNGSMFYSVDVSESKKLTGVISVDIIVGKQTLLEKIFIKAGAGDNG